MRLPLSWLDRVRLRLPTDRTGLLRPSASPSRPANTSAHRRTRGAGKTTSSPCSPGLYPPILRPRSGAPATTRPAIAMSPAARLLGVVPQRCNCFTHRSRQRDPRDTRSRPTQHPRLPYCWGAHFYQPRRPDGYHIRCGPTTDAATASRSAFSPPDNATPRPGPVAGSTHRNLLLLDRPTAVVDVSSDATILAPYYSKHVPTPGTALLNRRSPPIPPHATRPAVIVPGPP